MVDSSDEPYEEDGVLADGVDDEDAGVPQHCYSPSSDTAVGKVHYDYLDRNFDNTLWEVAGVAVGFGSRSCRSARASNPHTT